jgi:predicted short-subunit dehydrogenase-like oxidoreductase (DUF2520 family)
MSLGGALGGAGHDAVGVLARSGEAATGASRRFNTSPLGWDEDLPSADLLILAVRDDAIGEVAVRLAPHSAAARFAIHLSGMTPLSTLEPLANAGVGIGSFHPLQTLPNPVDGEASIPGAWVAVTAIDPLLQEYLQELAHSIGARPFPLADAHRELYHAAAVASSNYLIAALALADELFRRVGVPFEAAQPLVTTVTENAFRLGPLAALTGPIARGDITTVRGQLKAVARWVPEMEDDFRAFGKATARVAGTMSIFEDVL